MHGHNNEDNGVGHPFYRNHWCKRWSYSLWGFPRNDSLVSHFHGQLHPCSRDSLSKQACSTVRNRPVHNRPCSKQTTFITGLLWIYCVMDVVCYECSSTSRKFIGDKEGIALICIFILNTKQSAKTPKKQYVYQVRCP